FVAAVDSGVVRQRHQFFERGVHLLGRSLEKPAAARGEKRVAAKKIVLEKIRHVAGGVAGDEKNFAAELADLNFVAFIDAAAQAGNAPAVALVAVNLDRTLGENAFVAAGVIAVMMGVEDRLEVQRLLVE